MKTIINLLGTALVLAIASGALAEVHYVDVNSTNATPPYTNWTTAATNIQDAVDAAAAGDEIVVTNGTYATGGRVTTGDQTFNVVAVDKPLSVRSVNGPQSTIIYAGGARCVYLTTNASLSGFTLTGGDIERVSGGVYLGAGVFCESRTAVVSDCVISGNYAEYLGLPAYGGGAFGGTLNNCTLTSNWVGGYGGGAAYCALNNCTLAGNSADFGGGTFGGTMTNCITFENYSQSGCGGCDSPGRLSGNNWIGDPRFVDTNGWANLRLQSNSPCINAGYNASAPAGPDLDGNPRIAGGTVDIGAYEFQSPVSQISYAWLQQYCLPINSSSDTADPDGDAVDNYHEWLAGTNPTNSLSSPAQLTITPSGVPPSGIILSWPTNAVGFALQSTTNLFSPAAWVSNSLAPVVIAGQNTVTNPITGPQRFYRLIR